MLYFALLCLALPCFALLCTLYLSLFRPHPLIAPAGWCRWRPFSVPPSHRSRRVVPLETLIGPTLSLLPQGGAVGESSRSHPLTDFAGWCRWRPSFGPTLSPLPQGGAFGDSYRPHPLTALAGWTTDDNIIFINSSIIMQFFLISTDHLESRLWFDDKPDLVAGMNYVAISSFRFEVNVLAFILMSNHAHFILECERKEAEAFINFFKERFGLYRWNHHKDSKFLRRNRVDIQELSMTGESLERAIADVQMNCVAARLCAHPSGYPWGSGNVFFNLNPQRGCPVGTLSSKALARKMHSKMEVNPDWEMLDDGYISPASYVAVEFVESLFRSPSRYQYFLDNSSKAKRVKELTAPSFSDQLIATASLNLCHSIFRVTSIDDLSPAQTVELVRQLKRRFSSGANQISRVTGIQYGEVVSILEGFLLDTA